MICTGRPFGASSSNVTGVWLRADARRLSEAEELLQFHGGEDAAVVAIVELAAPCARSAARFRIASGDGDAARSADRLSAFASARFARFERIDCRRCARPRGIAPYQSRSTRDAPSFVNVCTVSRASASASRARRCSPCGPAPRRRSPRSRARRETRRRARRSRAPASRRCRTRAAAASSAARGAGDAIGIGERRIA